MFEVTVQRAVKSRSIPTTADFKKWVSLALLNKLAAAELTIRIVDENEMMELNSRYRNKHKPTNVLSFPMDLPTDFETEIKNLGDIVICAQVIKAEADAQNKLEKAHWAHMVVHGILHLMGYDHETAPDAEKMEKEEIKILKKLGFNNPYQTIPEE